MEQKKAAVSMAIVMMVFGTVGIFRRYIPLSSAMLSCIRGLSGALFLALLSLVRFGKLPSVPQKRNLVFLAVTGIMIGFNWILLFEAYNYTSIPTATLCYYMQPTIVILLSPVFLKEPLTLKKGLCAFAAFGGMILISGVIGQKGASSDLRGILLGLAAAALYAAVVMINKRISGTDPMAKTMIQLFTAGIILVPYLLVTEKGSPGSLTPVSIVLTAITGLVHTGLCYAVYFASLEKIPAQSTALLGYLDPLTALFLSALFFPEERLSVYGIMGAVLILGAALFSELEFKKKAHK